jgi:plasmid stabilization system protein ParE
MLRLSRRLESRTNEDNPDPADRIVNAIFNSIGLLVQFPDQGHRRPDLTSRPLRFKTLREYVIAYALRSSRCGWYQCSMGGAARG